MRILLSQISNFNGGVSFRNLEQIRETEKRLTQEYTNKMDIVTETRNLLDSALEGRNPEIGPIAMNENGQKIYTDEQVRKIEELYNAYKTAYKNYMGNTTGLPEKLFTDNREDYNTEQTRYATELAAFNEFKSQTELIENEWKNLLSAAEESIAAYDGTNYEECKKSYTEAYNSCRTHCDNIRPGSSSTIPEGLVPDNLFPGEDITLKEQISTDLTVAWEDVSNTFNALKEAQKQWPRPNTEQAAELNRLYADYKNAYSNYLKIFDQYFSEEFEPIQESTISQMDSAITELDINANSNTSILRDTLNTAQTNFENALANPNTTVTNLQRSYEDYKNAYNAYKNSLAPADQAKLTAFPTFETFVIPVPEKILNARTALSTAQTNFENALANPETTVANLQNSYRIYKNAYDAYKNSLTPADQAKLTAFPTFETLMTSNILEARKALHEAQVNLETELAKEKIEESVIRNLYDKYNTAYNNYSDLLYLAGQDKLASCPALEDIVTLSSHSNELTINGEKYSLSVEHFNTIQLLLNNANGTGINDLLSTLVFKKGTAIFNNDSAKTAEIIASKIFEINTILADCGYDPITLRVIPTVFCGKGGGDTTLYNFNFDSNDTVFSDGTSIVEKLREHTDFGLSRYTAIEQTFGQAFVGTSIELGEISSILAVEDKDQANELKNILSNDPSITETVASNGNETYTFTDSEGKSRSVQVRYVGETFIDPSTGLELTLKDVRQVVSLSTTNTRTYVTPKIKSSLPSLPELAITLPNLQEISPTINREITLTRVPEISSTINREIALPSLPEDSLIVYTNKELVAPTEFEIPNLNRFGELPELNLTRQPPEPEPNKKIPWTAVELPNNSSIRQYTEDGFEISARGNIFINPENENRTISFELLANWISKELVSGHIGNSNFEIRAYINAYFSYNEENDTFTINRYRKRPTQTEWNEQVNITTSPLEDTGGIQLTVNPTGERVTKITVTGPGGYSKEGTEHTLTTPGDYKIIVTTDAGEEIELTQPITVEKNTVNHEPTILELPSSCFKDGDNGATFTVPDPLPNNITRVTVLGATPQLARSANGNTYTGLTNDIVIEITDDQGRTGRANIDIQADTRPGNPIDIKLEGIRITPGQDNATLNIPNCPQGTKVTVTGPNGFTESTTGGQIHLTGTETGTSYTITYTDTTNNKSTSANTTFIVKQGTNRQGITQHQIDGNIPPSSLTIKRPTELPTYNITPISNVRTNSSQTTTYGSTGAGPQSIKGTESGPESNPEDDVFGSKSPGSDYECVDTIAVSSKQLAIAFGVETGLLIDADTSIGKLIATAGFRTDFQHNSTTHSLLDSATGLTKTASEAGFIDSETWDAAFSINFGMQYISNPFHFKFGSGNIIVDYRGALNIPFIGENPITHDGSLTLASRLNIPLINDWDLNITPGLELYYNSRKVSPNISLGIEFIKTLNNGNKFTIGINSGYDLSNNRLNVGGNIRIFFY